MYDFSDKLFVGFWAQYYRDTGELLALGPIADTCFQMAEPEGDETKEVEENGDDEQKDAS